MSSYPKEWTSSAIAAYYAIMVDTPKAIRDRMWWNQADEPNRHKWMLDTFWVGDLLNLSQETSRRARRLHLNSWTAMAPHCRSGQMLVLYAKMIGLIDYKLDHMGQAVHKIGRSTDPELLKYLGFSAAYADHGTHSIFNPWGDPVRLRGSELEMRRS